MLEVLNRALAVVIMPRSRRDCSADVLRQRQDQGGGNAMGAKLHGQDYAGYRDEVTELIRAGEPFGFLEDAIEELVDLSADEKAALWLFAFSLDRERDARHLVSVS